MTEKEQFEKFMLAGHGRCFRLLENHHEEYRDLILYGCLNDISFDLQCEGSRSCFMYNLALQYDDADFFLNAVIEKFLALEPDASWHIMNHLTDLLVCFAFDNHDKTAKTALDDKYHQLYDLCMSRRWSQSAHDITENYEYLAICLIQNYDFDRTLQIFHDIGAYFLKKKHTAADELQWRLSQFWFHVNEKYTKDFLQTEISKAARTSKEIRRFQRVMYVSDETSPTKNISVPTAEEMISQSQINPRQRSLFAYRADETEKIKLAEAVLSEPDLTRKTELLEAFTHSRNPWKLAIEPLLDYAQSDDEFLRQEAFQVLGNIKENSPVIHEFALSILKNHFQIDAFVMLMHHYQAQDKNFLMQMLNQIEIDHEDYGGGHHVIMELLDCAEENPAFPDEAVLWTYENSPCSCCRLSAVELMQKRSLLTDELIQECFLDSDSDIREFVEKVSNGLSE